MRNILFFFDTLTAFFGPLFGVIIADFYYVKKQFVQHKELFYPTENTVYIYTNGWNYRALYALLIGFIFFFKLTSEETVIVPTTVNFEPSNVRPELSSIAPEDPARTTLPEVKPTTFTVDALTVPATSNLC